MLQKLTKLKASALVVTMMILGIVLVSTLSIALVAVQERKASLGEDSSNQAYYKAEDGVEITMKAITQGELSNVNQIDGYLDNVTCAADGLLVGTGGFKVELKDSNEAKILCNSTTSIASVRSLKSVGTVGGNQRAVQVAVAQEGEYQIACMGPGLASAGTSCCRLNTSSGDVECKVFQVSGSPSVKTGWYTVELGFPSYAPFLPNTSQPWQ
jgi:hypothetical protein